MRSLELRATLEVPDMEGVDGVLVFTATPDATRAVFTFEITSVASTREVATDAASEVGNGVAWTFRGAQAEMFETA